MILRSTSGHPVGALSSRRLDGLIFAPWPILTRCDRRLGLVFFGTPPGADRGVSASPAKTGLMREAIHGRPQWKDSGTQHVLRFRNRPRSNPHRCWRSAIAITSSRSAKRPPFRHSISRRNLPKASSTNSGYQPALHGSPALHDRAREVSQMACPSSAVSQR